MDLKKKENSDMKKLQYNNCRVVKCLVSTTAANVDKRPDMGAFLVDTGNDDEICGVGLISENKMQEILPNAYIEKRIVINSFDKAVMDAVYTSWCDRGDRASMVCDITIREIFRRMIGGTNLNPGTDMRKRIKLSIFKLMNIFCLLNVSADLPRVIENLGLTEKMGKTGTGARIYGHLLEGRFTDIDGKNGVVLEAVTLTECPLLYQYAEAMQHIIGVEDEWLILPYSYNEKLIGIRDYLIGYIKSIKHRKEDSNQWVGYQTIFQGAGFPWSENAGTRSKNRAFVNKILDYYKCQELIWDYDVSDDLRQISIKLESEKAEKKKGKKKK